MSTPLLEHLTVLLVTSSDDAARTRSALEDADPALDVAAVASTGPALECVADGGVDAVVCAHDPPAIDAVAFTDAVRERRRDVPVLCYSLVQGASTQEAALAAGATDVFAADLTTVPARVLANRIRQFVRADAAGTREESGGNPSDSESGASDSESGASDSEPGASGSEPTVQARASGTGSMPADAPVGRFLGPLREHAEGLRTAERSDTVASLVVDVVGDLLDAATAGVYLFDDAENRLRVASATTASGDALGEESSAGAERAESPAWRSFVTGNPVALEGAGEAASTLGDAAALFTPLDEHGVLVLASDEPGALADDWRVVAELVAATATLALDRIDGERAVGERDRRLGRLDERCSSLDRSLALLCGVNRAVVRESTPDAVREAVVERVVADGPFAFAWIGSVDGESARIRPESWAGQGCQYLDDVALPVGESSEPACRTARTGATTRVDGVAGHLDEAWARAALARGFRAVVSVPLTYAGVPYGVLTAYADESDACRPPVTSVLGRVGETTAFAVHATERGASLRPGRATELRLRVPATDDALAAVSRATDGPVEWLDHAPLDDGRTTLVFSAEDTSITDLRAAQLHAVDRVTRVECDGPGRYRAVVSERPLSADVDAAGGTTLSLVADGGSVEATVAVPDAVGGGQFLERLGHRYPGTTVLDRRQYDGPPASARGFRAELERAVTDRQLEVLRTAHECGFFGSPREATGEDVADRLGVSQPTVSHHLREGQGKLFSLLFGDTG